MNIYCISLLLLSFHVTDNSGDLTLDQIIKAHSASWSSIYSMDIEYTYAFPNSGPDITREVHWTRKGNLSRYRKRDISTGLMEDMLFDGDEVRILSGWKPEYQGKMSLIKREGVHAQIVPQLPNMLAYVDPDCEMIRKFSMLGSYKPMLLSELASSWKTSLVGKVKSKDDRVLLRIHAEPNEKNGDPHHSYIDIDVNPDAGFMIEKLLIYDVDLHKDIGITAIYTREVTEFEDIGDGIFLPVNIEYRIWENGSTPTKDPQCIVDITKSAVNQPLPEDAFSFVFPSNTPVKHILTPQGKKPVARISIWGEDNKLLHEDLTSAEFNALLENKYPDVIKRRNLHKKTVADNSLRPFYQSPVIYVCMGLALIALVILFMKRTRQSGGKE